MSYVRFISPCQCSGSVALVHRSCIEKWLSTSNHDTCEICGHRYTISRHPRPLMQWLCDPAGQVLGQQQQLSQHDPCYQDDQRNMIGDIVCFVLLTPLATISAYLCASGASYYLEVGILIL